MSNIATLRPTLVDGIFRRSLTTDAVLVLAGAALTGLAAQVSVPTPIGVPFTLQTFAVLVIGASLGSVRGALSMLAYALLGAIGLPMFQGASGGFGVITGATGGFIIGFIAAAFVVGKLAELEWSSKFLKMLAAFVAGSIVIYGFGIPVLAAVSKVDLATAASWMVPFVFGDAVKAVAAGMTLPAAWALLRKLK